MRLKPKTPLGQLLLEKKVITPKQLQLALEEQKKSGELLGVTLLRLKFVDKETVYLPVLADQLGVDFVNLKETEISSDVIKKIPAKFAYHYKIMPVAMEKDTLVVALSKPLDIHILDDIGMVVKDKIRSVLASEKDIMEAIRKYYGVGAETIEKMMDTVETQRKPALDVEKIETIESDASIGRFVNQILIEAYSDRATDIHIEPYEDELKIRYRIDGVLYDAEVPRNIKHFKDSINSRIKILSNLNIAEKRLPQDGRFKIRLENTELDFRVSFLPTSYGESVVIRVLSAAKLYSLERLGLSKKNLELLDHLIKRPHGIIFVTGPTGSGKTTTLYSCLSKVNQPDRKIITIEDPVEYRLKGVTQIQVNPKIGLTFASGLRSMLRHDPDIMMVGEVRDIETAEITFQVALTGHLVFSTLHTNDAASSIARLLDMGVEDYLITSSVDCIIAQRLVRVICPECKAPIEHVPDLAKDFEIQQEELKNVVFYEGKGCEACKFTGFQGREGIYEFLTINDEIRRLILDHKTATAIKDKGVSMGMRTLRQDGWEKVKKGITTPAEVIRVTQEEIE